MRVIRARNVNLALLQGLNLLDECGISRKSRAGTCVTAPVPVTTVYENPCERVVFWPERNANPFFHFFEALYFLAGRSDAAFLDLFIRDYSKRFSEDGLTLSSTYGYRWRRHWLGNDLRSIDQIRTVIKLLRNNPDSRRAVISMWDPETDLQEDENLKDIPCNTTVMFRSRFGRRDEPNMLDMTVTCRSNDMIFGAYGANAVHFSFLHEYVAASLGLRVGHYYQVSNDFHAYDDVLTRVSKGGLARWDRNQRILTDPYSTFEVKPYPLIKNAQAWDNDLAIFMETPAYRQYDNPFFKEVAAPLWFAHAAYRRRNLTEAIEIASHCYATDWRMAALDWLERRRLPPVGK